MNKLLRLAYYFLAALVALIVVYAILRFIQIAVSSQYQGERGPYLQMPAPDAMTIVWQTEADIIGTLRYGKAPDELDQFADTGRLTDIHAIRLHGLEPDTRYYYALGAKGQKEIGGKDFWFVTPPQETAPIRFWVLGDPGLPGPLQLEVRDAMLHWIKQHPRSGRPWLDLILTTGDNAYTSGENKQYQTAFFEPFESVLRNIPVWPAYGNHDARRWAYFDLFMFPTRGESGGLESGTENYFSFDYGDVHFVMLDSESTSRRADGAMHEWLRRDLAANRKKWLIAVFHHPPYTRGTHNSDDAGDSRGRMQDMRETFLPVLEQAGVDLVFSGHSHMYERSYFITCHYGRSTELQAGHFRNKTLNGPYLKQKEKAGANEGTVYLVVGSSARIDQGPLDHPVMAVAKRIAGSVLVDINGNKLITRFIDNKGQVVDEFSIEKGVTTAPAGNVECR
ncbi:MAG: metallophosphoesterase family protein [Gammaproteobacteria bacterium]|nr:metallophosphoesterase family protein [Gammaproteobacteria bacterium]MDH5651917.1 metallophosphoesterase family protein [Gammaproteobacteria bacterium]